MKGIAFITCDIKNFIERGATFWVLVRKQVKGISFRSVFRWRSSERYRTMTISYPFIRHIPAVIVMSVSHVSRYAMMWMDKGSGIPL